MTFSNLQKAIKFMVFNYSRTKAYNMLNTLTDKVSKNFTPEVVSNIIKKKSSFTNPIVKEITFGNPTEKGESYLSVVTRFSLLVYERDNPDKTETIAIIAKSFPDNLARRKTFRSEVFFQNEIAFYDKVWPLLQAFQESKNVKNPLNIVPECLAFVCDGNDDFIALEDLSYQKYDTIPRNTGFDYEQTVQVIRIFGQFHALSMAFKDQNNFNNMIEALNETYFDEKFRSWYTPVMKKVFTVLQDAVEKELSNEYMEKLNDLMARDMYGECCKICKDHSLLCGVSQGDCWAPNFLVKYSNQAFKDIKIIDYQLARCAPVVTDLTFFLYICVDPLIREQHWNDLIKKYCDSVSENLKELGSDPSLVSVDIIEDAMRQIGMFTLVMGAEAAVMSAAEEVADIDDIQEATTLDNVWILKPMRNVENRKKLAGLFKHLVDGKYV